MFNHPGQHLFGAREVGHVEHDRAEAADLVLRRHRTFGPGRSRPGAAVIDQHQTLALLILERQRQPTVDFSDLAGMAAGLLQPIPPVAEAFFAGDAQSGARDAVAAAPLRGSRKIEEGEVGAGIGLAVGVEQMVGADIVLVDSLLDQPHPEQTGVECQIVAGPCRNRGQVMNPRQLHRIILWIAAENRRRHLGPIPDHVGYGSQTRQRYLCRLPLGMTA
jgi:hypothetical protein